jgi:Ca-activated chloride channel family protein
MTHVRAQMDGRVIRYEIEDRYVNRGNRPAEVDYVLPLPKGAAFENLELSINGEMIAGETMRAERARAVYEEIVRKLRDPALVEWMGHDLLRTRIFPIQPGEEKRVVVRFSAVVQREGDAIRLDWPARAMAGARTDDDWFELRYPLGGSLALGEPYSPTHSLNPRDRGAERDREFRTVRANGAHSAMTLLVPVRRASEATLSLLSYAPGGEDGYALITVTPPARLNRTTPRDLTFVIDVSGSMSGQKLVQAKAAGVQFLNSLERGDRFRLIAFSSDVRDWRGDWSTVTDESIRSATRFLDDLRATGGTNIDGAVAAALSADSPRGRLPLVLMLTDGAPTVGETNADAIARHAADLRGKARLFTFGLGADVNAALMEQLALQGRGTATFVRPQESVERAVGVVASRLTSPVATDVSVRLDDARLYATQPQGQIDIFAGQDLVVLARYTGRADWTTLIVEGRGPDGPVRWTQRVRLPARRSENAFVGRLWAVQRIGWLSAERRRTGGNSELDGELRQLGERYGIPTELTSYLVVEPGMNTAQIASTAPSPVRGRSLPFSVAPAPAVAGAGGASSDQARFEAAKQSAEQRDMKSLGDERSRLAEADGKMKVAGGRAFRADKDGVWTEAKERKAERVVKVRAYSAAYFAILREIPELAQLFAVGDKARVEGRAVAIEVSTDSGAETLDDDALRALVKDWR